MYIDNDRLSMYFTELKIKTVLIWDKWLYHLYFFLFVNQQHIKKQNMENNFNFYCMCFYVVF